MSSSMHNREHEWAIRFVSRIINADQKLQCYRTCNRFRLVLKFGLHVPCVRAIYICEWSMRGVYLSFTEPWKGYQNIDGGLVKMKLNIYATYGLSGSFSLCRCCSLLIASTCVTLIVRRRRVLPSLFAFFIPDFVAIFTGRWKHCLYHLKKSTYVKYS